jgi:hypothetical protein
VSRGISTGFILGFLMTLGFNLILYAQLNLYNTKILAIDTVLSGVMGGITGAVLGWWFGRSKS